jgi:hypothetical protein
MVFTYSSLSHSELIVFIFSYFARFLAVADLLFFIANQQSTLIKREQGAVANPIGWLSCYLSFLVVWYSYLYCGLLVILPLGWLCYDVLPKENLTNAIRNQ